MRRHINYQRLHASALQSKFFLTKLHHFCEKIFRWNWRWKRFCFRDFIRSLRRFLSSYGRYSIVTCCFINISKIKTKTWKLTSNERKISKTGRKINKKIFCFRNFASLSATIPSQSLENSLKRLDQDVRRSGRISRRDLEEILDEIRTNKSATSSQSLLVIRCCGNLVPEEMPETRTKMVQEIWKT